MVPAQAVQIAADGQYVFVVKKDSTVDKRLVTAEILNENDAIITKGVQPGETVVTDGQLRLDIGTRVTIKTSNSAAGINQP